MRRSAPEVALRLEIGFEEGMMQGLVQGTLDIGVMYTPERRPGLGIERLFDEPLVLAFLDHLETVSLHVTGIEETDRAPRLGPVGGELYGSRLGQDGFAPIVVK